MIYLIITTSINNKVGNTNSEHRMNRYISSIQSSLNHIRPSLIRNERSSATVEQLKTANMPVFNVQLSKDTREIKPIIVENNGIRPTYLDTLNCDILYTNNNSLQLNKHKGVNELFDIKEVIQKYNISDDDIIVKLTGRYKILDNSFFKIVKDNIDKYDAFIKFFNVCTLEYMQNDCVLGLFAIRAKYLKEFNYNCINSAEVEFSTYVRNSIPANKIMEIMDLKLECCFADDLRILLV